MPKNTRKHVNIPSVTKPRDRKRVAARMRRKPNAGNVTLLPEQLEVSFKVANADFCIILCAKDVARWKDGFVEMSLKIPPKGFAKFKAEGYKSVFSALPVYLEGQIVQIYIAYRKTKSLGRTKAGIKNSKRNKVSAMKIDPPVWLETKYGRDLRLRKRR